MAVQEAALSDRERNTGPLQAQSALVRVPVWLLRIAGAITVVAFLVLLFNAKPMGDDYCRAALEPVNGIPGWQPATGIVDYNVQTYMRWSGRWLSGLLETVALRGGIMAFYALAMWGFLVLELGLLWSFLCFLFPEWGSRYAAVYTLLFGLLLWSTMPAPGDSLFWFVGHMENVVSPSLLLLLVIWLCNGEIGPWRGAAIVSLAIALPVLHEITGMMLLSLACLAGWRAYAKAVRNRHWWAAVVLLAAGSLLISVSSPGNTVRMKIENPVGNLQMGLLAAAQQVRTWWPMTLLQPGLWAATLLFVIDGRVRASRPPWVAQYLGGYWKFVSFAFYTATIFTVFVMPSVVRADNLSARTITQVHIFFLLGWFFHLFVFTRGLAAYDLDAHWAASLRAVAMTILACSILIAGNTMTAYGDLLHRVLPWNAAMEARAKILRSVGPVDAVVPVLPPRPFLYFPSEIGSDPAYWRNRCVAAYYGVKSVRTETEPVQ